MRRAQVLAVVASLAAWQAAAVAGPPPPGWEHRQAVRDAAEGHRLLKAGQFDEALFKLKSAYAVDPTAETLADMAEAQRGGGRTLEAYASYEALLRDHAAELSADQKQAAEAAIAELGQKTGTVRVTIRDAAASFAIDGEAVPADAVAKPIRLLIGMHKLVVTKAGSPPATYDVIIHRGKEAEVPPPASPTVAPPPPPVPVVTPPPPPAPAPVAPAPPPPPVVAPAPPPIPAPPPPAAAPPPPVAPPAPAPVEAPAAPPPPIVPIPAPIPEETAPSPVPAAAPAPAPEPKPEDPLRVGVMVGLLSLPRPVELGLTFKVGRWFCFAVEASFLPQLSIPAVDGKVNLKALQGVFRWYPFGNAFFLGGGLGYQNFQASFGESIDGGELKINADMSGAFALPEIGWMWIFDNGFAMGLTFGVQIPIPREPVVTATYNGQPVPNQATSSVPQDVVDQAQSNRDDIASLAKLIVRYPFPEIDFLRIGFFF